MLWFTIFYWRTLIIPTTRLIPQSSLLDCYNYLSGCRYCLLVYSCSRVESKKTFAVYLGQNTEESAAGFVVENGFFAVLEINSPEAENQLRLTTEALHEFLKNESPDSPNKLKQLGEQIYQKYKLSSLAIGYFHKNQLLTFCRKAAVLLLQQNQLYFASQQDTALAGNFSNRDNYLFCTAATSKLLIGKAKSPFKKQEPKEIIDEFKNTYSPNQGALLVVQTLIEIPDAEPKTELPPSHNLIIKSKWIKIAILAAILILVLIQTIGIAGRFLDKRRAQAFTEQFLVLSQQYNQLEKDLQISPSKAAKQIETLNTALNNLIDRYPTQAEKATSLKQKLNSLAKLYGNAQTTKEELFFDLSLINKRATANYLDVTAEYLSLLDNQNKQAYSINIEDKKVTEVNYNKVTKAQLVTEYDGQLYLYDKNSGIYKEQNGRFVKIINKDKSWGTIIDLDVFNSNVYLLSQSTDEIFKFTPTAEGYSPKLSYFQTGESIDLQAVKNMSIDFSIYLLGEQIYKYTAGARDNFQSLPQLNYVNFNQLYKDSETNFIYLLDKNAGRIVAINKDGRLIKSIFNPLLKDCLSFGVHQDELIIFLRQNKLYKLDNF